MSSNQSSILSPWLALLLLSVLLRVAYGKFVLADHWPGDASWYLQAAESLVDNGWVDPYWPPGLPHLLAGGLFLGIGEHWLGMVVAIALWVVFFWVLRTAVFERQSNTRGWWIKAIFVVYPAFLHQSVVPLTYLPVAILLLMCWQWTCGTWGGPPWQEQVGLGLSMGLMALFRGASIAIWPVFLVAYMWSRGGWKHILVPTALAFLVLGAWEMKLYHQEDRFVWINTANSYNFYLGNNPWTPDYKTWLLGSHDLHGDPGYTAFYEQIDSVRSLPAAQQEVAFRELGWAHISAEPLHFLSRAISRLATLLSFDTLAGATIFRQSRIWGIIFLVLDAACFLALLLLAWYGWDNGHWYPREKLLWLSICAAYSLPYLLAFAHPTYHLPLMPMFAWAAFRADGFSWKNLANRPVRSWVVLGFLLLCQVIWVWNMAGSL